MTPRLDKLARYLDGDRPDAPLGERLVTGAAVGAIFAIFTPILLFLWAAGGRELALRRGGVMRVDFLAALYPLGAIVSCALLFALTALARTRLLRALLGAVAMLPWAAGIVICIDRGYSAWKPLHTATTILTAIAIGAPVGWRMALGRRQSRMRRSAV